MLAGRLENHLSERVEEKAPSSHAGVCAAQLNR